MAKIKLALDKLSKAEKITKANTYKTGLTGNANFTTPVPTLVAYAAAITDAQTKLNAQDAAVAAAKNATIASNLSSNALDALTNQLAAYVLATSGGDVGKIASANFEIAAFAQGASAMPQVHNLSATTGDNDGEIDLHWDKIKNAHSYEIQRCDDPPVDANYGNSVSCTETKRALTGLHSGTKMWFRVRAIGGAGPGPWSDPGHQDGPVKKASTNSGLVIYNPLFGLKIRKSQCVSRNNGDI